MDVNMKLAEQAIILLICDIREEIVDNPEQNKTNAEAVEILVDSLIKLQRESRCMETEQMLKSMNIKM